MNLRHPPYPQIAADIKLKFMTHGWGNGFEFDKLFLSDIGEESYICFYIIIIITNVQIHSIFIQKQGTEN
jgi:hypothetical protein